MTRIDENGTWEIQDGISILIAPSEKWINENQPIKTDDEKKALLRPIRNTLLDEADIKYCNADKWEVMDANKKTEWRNWKQNMKDWIGVDLDLGTFPTMPE